MSKFDVAVWRTIAHETHDDRLIRAVEYISVLEDRIAVLERVRKAASLYLRTGRGDLEAALAACDDGEVEPDGPTAYDVAKDKARRGQ